MMLVSQILNIFAHDYSIYKFIMTKTFGDYIVLIISIFGSLASIVAFGIYFAPHLNEQGFWGVIFLGLISLFFGGI